MKKKLTLLFLILITLCYLPEGYSKATQRKGSSSSSRLKSGTTPAYAIFNCPLDGKIPTTKDFGLKGWVKSYREEADDASFVNIYREFDQEGRLVLQEIADQDSYGRYRRIFRYGPEGNVSTILYSFQSGGQEATAPFVEAKYEYKWKDGRVSEIIETLSVDQGKNYKGSPTHLELKYDEKGNLVSAFCKENPKINFKINDKGKLSKNYYDCDYRNYIYNSIRVDDLFEYVNNKKASLKWNIISDESDDENTMNSLILNNLFFYYDDKNNWIKGVDKNSHNDVLLREITYYQPGQSAAQKSPRIVFVNSSSVNVREQPDINSKVFRKALKYEAYEVANANTPSDWTPIKFSYYDDQKKDFVYTTGFINSKYVTELENYPIPKSLIDNKYLSLVIDPKSDLGGSLNFTLDGNKFNCYLHISVISWVKNGGSGTAEWADIDGEWVAPGYLKVLSSKRPYDSDINEDKIVVYDKPKGLLYFGGCLWNKPTPLLRN